MTTFLEEEKRCAVCGERSKHTVVASTSVFGSSDLDTRPPELERATLPWRVQTCPCCGYCAPDLSESIEKAAEVVQRDSYQQQLKSEEFPRLANAFLCLSMIHENVGDFVSAGWDTIHASWACDDGGAEAGAIKCRKMAVDRLLRARERGQSFSKIVGAEEAVIADLMRRSGQFKPALEICEEGLRRGPEELIASILNFQKKLIEESDVGCHTVDEAVEGQG